MDCSIEITKENKDEVREEIDLICNAYQGLQMLSTLKHLKLEEEDEQIIKKVEDKIINGVGSFVLTNHTSSWSTTYPSLDLVNLLYPNKNIKSEESNARPD
tara:strand:- start:443 stop:745 length:303 start_codon:yes stop_codon:yes gene_type:complete